MDEIQREVMEQDVLLVGAGPANLACAIKLMQLVAKHNESATEPLAPQVTIIEKGTEIGHHQLSGAVMDLAGVQGLTASIGLLFAVLLAGHAAAAPRKRP